MKVEATYITSYKNGNGKIKYPISLLGQMDRDLVSGNVFIERYGDSIFLVQVTK